MCFGGKKSIEQGFKVFGLKISIGVTIKEFQLVSEMGKAAGGVGFGREDQEFSFECINILVDIQVKTLNRQLVIEISRKIRFREIYLGIGNI